MQFRVEELAAAAGIRVDTIRFYQGRGLLPSPRRMGRVAIYEEAHLERLRRIRELRQQGFTLAQIRSVLERPDPASDERLLRALVSETVGERTLSRDELAAEAGVPPALVRAVETAGLIEPLLLDGEERFGESDLAMARAGLYLVEAGLPLPELLGLAVTHGRNVQEVCDAAIELFDEHVRRGGSAANGDEAITEAFRQLLPQVTRLVALHFQRTLVTRALNRLRSKKDSTALAAALAATESAHLDVEVTWR